jgi:ribosomal protein L27
MIHNGFAQRDLIERVVAAGFVKAEVSAFYHGKGVFMGKDATMFILEAQKQDM